MWEMEKIELYLETPQKTAKNEEKTEEKTEEKAHEEKAEQEQIPKQITEEIRLEKENRETYWKKSRKEKEKINEILKLPISRRELPF